MLTTVIYIPSQSHSQFPFLPDSDSERQLLCTDVEWTIVCQFLSLAEVKGQ